MARSLKPFPESDRLRSGIIRCADSVEPFNGTVYRAVSYRYANQSDLVTGVGAKLHGARWNPPGQFNAVYGSLNPFAALAETGAIQSRFGIPFAQRTPLVMVAATVRLKSVLNLANGENRRKLGVSLKRLLETDWENDQRAGAEALTQAIGRLAFEHGLEGILVPSAQLLKENNLVLFPANMAAGSHVRVINRKTLPQRRATESD